MASRSGDEHVARGGGVAQGADDLALRRERVVIQVEQALHFGLPGCLELRCPGAVFLAHLVALQRRAQLFERHARVGGERDGRVFVGVEFGGIDVDKAHACVLEGRLRGSGEVGVTRANADHQVGIVRQAVSSQRAGGADGAHILWVVVGEGAFACLRLPSRNSGLLDQARQGLLRATVKHASPHHD